MTKTEYEVPRYLAHSKELLNYWANYSSAGVLIFSEDGEMILLGNHREAPQLWGNFAGSKNSGDQNAFETAIRETHEEIGLLLSLNDLGVPLILDASPKTGIIFPVTISTTTNIVLPNEGEIIQPKWFTSDEVSELIIDQIDSDFASHGVWGGAYTLEVITSWLEIENKSKSFSEFGGKVAYIDEYPAFYNSSPYAKIKRSEKGN